MLRILQQGQGRLYRLRQEYCPLFLLSVTDKRVRIVADGTAVHLTHFLPIPAVCFLRQDRDSAFYVLRLQAPFFVEPLLYPGRWLLVLQ